MKSFLLTLLVCLLTISSTFAKKGKKDKKTSKPTTTSGNGGGNGGGNGCGANGCGITYKWCNICMGTGYVPADSSKAMAVLMYGKSEFRSCYEWYQRGLRSQLPSMHCSTMYYLAGQGCDCKYDNAEEEELAIDYNDAAQAEDATTLIDPNQISFFDADKFATRNSPLEWPTADFPETTTTSSPYYIALIVAVTFVNIVITIGVCFYNKQPTQISKF